MHKETVRAALLLALMIVFQSLRLFVPLPPFISMFLVGSIINACLLLTIEFSTLRAGVIIACLAPVIAFMQQALPLPIFILPVALTNVCYLTSYKALAEKNYIAAIVTASIVRMLTLYLASSAIFAVFKFQSELENILRIAMSWPQLITGILGGVLTITIVRLASKTNLS